MNAAGGAFDAVDLTVISVLLLVIFGVYLYKLVGDLGHEEEEVHEALELTDADKAHRRTLVYEHVTRSKLAKILLLLGLGVLGAFLGGERVAEFAQLAIVDLGLGGILAAVILAAFAGMSEYVILWTSHRKQEYGIALANAFGGITQLLFLIVPFTLGAIAFYQVFINPTHADFPIAFSNILLVIFLFPTFHTLAALLENDHTMGILIAEEEVVPLRIPPMIGDGARMELPLRGLGAHNFYLRARIRIGAGERP